MYQILFVDDEPDVLRAIARVMRRREPEWKCEFAGSGKEGLVCLEDAAQAGKPHDVVVSDMRMPRMDGPAFLAKVRERYPDTIRIVLSGAADLESNLRVIPVAHQFLKKPLDMNQLRSIVVRSCDLREIMKNEALRRIVSELESLPVLPGLYTELTEAVSNPHTSMADVGQIIERDPGMSAKVLQMVNSAFFGTSRSVANVQQAVTFLGLPQIRQLLLVLEVFNSFEQPKNKKLRYFSMTYEREHALLTAKIARALVSAKDADHAFTGGVLHDVGKLVLATGLPDRFAEVFHRSLIEDRRIDQLERSEFGVSHAEVGAYLLALWGLPDPVVEAVAFHHRPDLVQHESFDVVSAVHVANYLGDPRPDKPLYLRDLSEDYLDNLGVLGKLDGWREMARKIQQAGFEDE